MFGCFMKKVTETVAQLARPVAEKNGCTLWDVEYLKEGGQWYLRIYIDNEEGVTIDQCEAVSREMDVLLDQADPIETSYILEVSSAGLERTLKRPEDFARFIGHLVEVGLYKPMFSSKTHVGRLLAYTDGDVDIDAGGETMHFPGRDIAQVRLRMEF